MAHQVAAEEAVSGPGAAFGAAFGAVFGAAFGAVFGAAFGAVWGATSFGTAFGAAGVLAVAWPAARSSRCRWQVLAATGAAQLLVHRAVSVRHPVRLGHPEGHDGVPRVVHATHHGSWTMTAAHGVAACVMALLVYRADQVLSRLPEKVGRWARTRIAAAAAALGARCRLRVRPRPRTVSVPLDGLALRPRVTTMLCHAVVRRGPPARCAGDVPLIPAGRAPAR
ncbi:hypothetical protein [Streptomyces sp. NPDC058613]|uniref:hypothetical protein n=1 Tax=unclassified Streptomyces TaxID=2593676 RepID=UPI00364A4C64